MSHNPLLKKLGFSNNDRAVIFHADDINMNQASLEAYMDLSRQNFISSAAAMVPCPWFSGLVKYNRDYLETAGLDIGVHLTLTSEWDNYRWRPIAVTDSASGLIDEEGCFYPECAPVQEQAQEAAVRQELAAQIDRALASGIDVTHIDSHMGALFHPRLLPIYLDMAMVYQLPALMLRPEAIGQDYEELVEPEILELFSSELREMEAAGFPLLDNLEITSLSTSDGRLQEAMTYLERLPVGVSYFIIHPAKDSPELRATAPDWRSRVADYELFMSDAWHRAIEASGVKVIGWQVIRDIMRAESTTQQLGEALQ
jgi:predicted glycoside hydrolase/deacetylase ChbG (UPF0249 family)